MKLQEYNKKGATPIMLIKNVETVKIIMSFDTL